MDEAFEQALAHQRFPADVGVLVRVTRWPRSCTLTRDTCLHAHTGRRNGSRKSLGSPSGMTTHTTKPWPVSGRVASWFAWSFSLVPQLGLVRSWFINLPPSHRRSPLGVSARVGRGGLVGKHRAPSHRRPQVSGHTIEDTGLIRPWFSSVPPSQTRSAVGVCAPVGHGRLVEKKRHTHSQRRAAVGLCSRFGHARFVGN